MRGELFLLFLVLLVLLEAVQGQEAAERQTENVKKVCFPHVHDEFSPEHLRGEVWQLCVTQEAAEDSHELSEVSREWPASVVSVIRPDTSLHVTSLENNLEVLVHPSLNDARANSSSCLPSEIANEKCNFRSAVALCALHLTAEEKNCTIVMSPFDAVLLSADYGQMPRVTSGLGALSVIGRGSSFSVAEGSSSLQMLFVEGDSAVGELRFSLSDCSINNFGNNSVTGGAIYTTGVIYSRVDNCTFYNNTGYNGGAVHIGSYNSHVDVIDSFFERNHAADAGGGLYIDSFNDDFYIQNVNFSKNTALHGGGLYINNENVDFVVDSCYFDDNVVEGIGGGAFIYSNSVNFIMKYCEFTKNSAVKYYAGGLYLYSRNQIEMHFVRFIGNLALYGGGLNGDSDNDYSLVSNCYFERNEASFGGALTLYASHIFFIIENTTFHDNYAPISGGALHFGVNNDDILLRDLHFSNNTAAVDGGAFLLTSANVNLVMRRCSFFGNTALNSGGGIYSAIATSNFLIDSCRWEHNTCSLFGGGIYFGDSHFGVTMRNSVMNYNTAISNSGGGYFINRFNGGIVIEHSEFIGNSALESGGGIYSSSSSFDMISSRLIDNRVLGGKCGGILVLRSDVGSILDSNISFNGAIGGARPGVDSVDASGGGMCIEISSRFIVDSCYFASNRASMNGGALYIQQGTNVSVRKSLFLSNVATVGGAVDIKSSFFGNFSDIIFSNNIAADDGGSFATHDSVNTGIFYSHFIRSQTSTGFGSSIWATNSPLLLIFNNYFKDSEALEGGGTIFWVHITMNEPLALSSNTFDSCQAVYGNKIATEGYSFELNSSVVTIRASSEYIAPLNVTLLDYYGQRVYTESHTTVYMTSVFVEGQCQEAGYVTGGTSAIFSRGVSTFDSVEVHCQPDASFNVSLEAISNSYNILHDFNFYLEDCVMGEIHDNQLCLKCPAGSYSFDPTSTECLTCPDDAECPGGSVIDVKPGFWRQTQQSHDVLACSNEDNCLGGTEVADQCRNGHEGPLCNVCQSGYALAADNSCTECGASAGILGVGVLAGIFVIAAILCFLNRKYLIRRFKSLLVYFQEKTKDYDLSSFKTKGKILFFFFQIISAMPTALNLFYPNPFSYVLEFFSLTNINVISLLSLGCVFSSNFFNKLRLFTLGPIVLATVAVSALYMREAHAKLKRPDNPSYTVLQRNGHRRVVLILIGFMFLSPTSVVIFQTFACETFEDGLRTLVADSSVECFTTLHITYIVYASLMILIYPIGIPCFYFYHLYRRRKLINPEDSEVEQNENMGDIYLQFEKIKLRNNVEKIQNLRQLYSSYLPRHMYFEVVDCVRRLLLTALPILVLRSTILQIILLLLISLFFCALYMEYKPFVLISDNRVAILCQWVISVTLIASLCIRVDMTDDFSFGTGAVGIFLTIVVSSIFIYTASVTIVRKDESEEVDMNTENTRSLIHRGSRNSSMVVNPISKQERSQHTLEINTFDEL